MEISTAKIKELRDKSGAGVMESRAALIETNGDFDKALELLKKQALAKVEKKSQRTASQGSVATYIHTGGRIGAIVEFKLRDRFRSSHRCF